MAQNDVFLADYFTSAPVKKRNSVGLNNWAGYNATAPIPDPPSDEWIRVRIAAESIPISLENYTNQTVGYFLQDPSTKTNINSLLSPSNTEGQEVSLSAQVEGVIGGFMPRFTDTYITHQAIDAWRKQNGYELPPPTMPEEELGAFYEKQKARRAARVEVQRQLAESAAERSKEVAAIAAERTKELAGDR